MDVRVEEGLVGAADGLGVVVGGALLGVVEELGLGDEDEADVAFDGVGLPDVGVGVGPVGDLACHLGARGDGAVHGEGAEGSEERAVEQGPPARIEEAARAASAGDEVPDAHVFGVGFAAVFAGAADDLGLHP